MSISKEEIARINELAKKSRTEEGLTDDEKSEQKALREKYIASWRESIISQLDNTVIQEPDGTLHPLKRNPGLKN